MPTALEEKTTRKQTWLQRMYNFKYLKRGFKKEFGEDENALNSFVSPQGFSIFW